MVLIMKKNKNRTSQRIVINHCYGGFGLSMAAIKKLHRKKSDVVRYSPFENWCKHSEETSFSGKKKYIENAYNFPVVKKNNEYMVATIETGDLCRIHPDVLEVVETMGKESWGRYSELCIVEIPGDIDWYISEYDGIEKVEEYTHRSW